jgi:glutamate/tyrosine decarboxylase-like PLP-dependent enzyme
MLGTCRLAQRLAARIDAEPELERLAPVPLNIVCFRYRAGEDSDRLNAELVTQLQESGLAAPSTTRIGGRLAIRAAIVGHRTRSEDVDALVEMVLELGRRLAQPAPIVTA